MVAIRLRPVLRLAGLGPHGDEGVEGLVLLEEDLPLDGAGANLRLRVRSTCASARAWYDAQS